MPNNLGHITPIISDFTYGELSPKMLGRIDSDVYHKGAQTVQNFVPLLQGGFRKRQGTLLLGTSYNDVTCRLYKIVVSASLWYILEFTNNLIRVWKGGTTPTLLGTTYATTYTTAELPFLQFGWGYPDMFIAHQNHPPASFRYTGDGMTDVFAFVNPIPIVGSSPVYFTGTCNSANKIITAITALDGGLAPNAVLITLAGKPISACYSAALSSYAGYGIPLGNTVATVDSAIQITMTGSNSNYSGTVIFAISQDSVLPFLTDWPGCVACANQRTYWASSKLYPESVWASIVEVWDSRYDMQMQMFELIAYTIQAMRVNGSNQPLDSNGVIVSAALQNVPQYLATTKLQIVVGDADGFYGEVYSDQNNVIQWMVSAIDLIMGTLSGQVMISGDSTANNFAFRNISRTGCAPIQGYFMAGGILFADRAARRVLLLDWQGALIQLKPPDTISIFSDHLFNTDPIIQMTYSASPVMRLWFLRASGSIVCCEYDDKYGVRAWWTFVTDGVIQSIAVGPSVNEDVLFIAVTRNAHTTIEMMATSEWLPSYYNGRGTLTNPAPIFLDCAVQKYNASPFTTVTDALLASLVGKTCTYWCVLHGGSPALDIMYTGTAAVTAGPTITVPSCNYAIIGIPFTSKLTTMPIEAGNQQDSTQARKLSIPRIGITYLNTLDAQVLGVQGGNPENAVLNGTPSLPTLFSGQEISPVPSGFALGSSITIQSSKPLPCMVNALVPEIMGYE